MALFSSIVEINVWLARSLTLQVAVCSFFLFLNSITLSEPFFLLPLLLLLLLVLVLFLLLLLLLFLLLLFFLSFFFFPSSSPYFLSDAAGFSRPLRG